MTIYDTAPDLFIATLFRDFVADAGSIAAGVPSNTAVPKEVMDMGKEPSLPSMVFAAKEEGSKGARRTVSVSAILLTWLKSADAGAADVAEQTDRDEAAGWVAKVSQRLRMMEDVVESSVVTIPGFKTWLSSLPSERRAGWVISKIVHHGLAAPQRNKEKRTIFHAVTFDVHVRLVRSA